MLPVDALKTEAELILSVPLSTSIILFQEEESAGNEPLKATLETEEPKITLSDLVVPSLKEPEKNPRLFLVKCTALLTMKLSPLSMEVTVAAESEPIEKTTPLPLLKP